MLSKPDFLEATRRYKNKKLNGHERQRYHALLLVTKGYSYRETADILFVDEETISRSRAILPRERPGRPEE
jgi:Homeodomain-like domain